MPLPIKTLPILEQWDCHGCGICCRGVSVLLNDADLKRLARPALGETSRLSRQEDRRSRRAFRPPLSAGASQGRTCVFQDADRRCRIHREFGYDAKPHVCRMAPLQMIALEKFAYVTLRRYCPSAAADEGRPMEEHVEEYRRLAVASDAVPEPIPPPKLTHGYRRPWKEVMAVAEMLNEFMLDERYPLVRRLVHGLEFCRLLEQCRLKKIAGSSAGGTARGVQGLGRRRGGAVVRQPRAARVVRRAVGSARSRWSICGCIPISWRRLRGASAAG